MHGTRGRTTDYRGWMLRPRLDERPALFVICELGEQPVAEPCDRQLVFDHVRREPAGHSEVDYCDLLERSVNRHVISRFAGRRLALFSPAVPLFEDSQGIFRIRELPAVARPARANLFKLLLPVKANGTSRVVVDQVDVNSELAFRPRRRDLFATPTAKPEVAEDRGGDGQRELLEVLGEPLLKLFEHNEREALKVFGWL